MILDEGTPYPEYKNENMTACVCHFDVRLFLFEDMVKTAESHLCLDGYNYPAELISIVGLTSRQDSSMESNIIITVCAVINTAINLYKLIVGKKE